MPASAARSLHIAEPAPRKLSRPAVVADASVVAAAIFVEPQFELAWQRLAGASLHAPWLIDIEIGLVALSKSRGRHRELADAGMLQYAGLAIWRHSVDVAPLVSLATRYQLTVYDAAYLLVASELRAPLITFDTKLAEAARLHLGSLQ
ncbi:MAG: hypothetical protein RI906_2553 [Pseudomonadota bacterium]|jgi:predicted nucleic acid-binding protein